MKIESAQHEDKLIGYRITEGDDTVLIWINQNLMSGIRIGKGFTPGIGKTILYTEQSLNDHVPIKESAK